LDSVRKARAKCIEAVAAHSLFEYKVDASLIDEVANAVVLSRTTRMECMCGRTLTKTGWKADKVKSSLLKLTTGFVNACSSEVDKAVDAKDYMFAPLYDIVDKATEVVDEKEAPEGEQK
jgi:hypothetical protein